jgi:hypothetical protein
MPRVSDRVYRIEAPYEGNAVHLYVASTHALQQLGPDAPFLELAQTAFREMVFDLPLVFDRRSIVPAVAARAIRAHLEAHGWRAATPDAAARR